MAKSNSQAASSSEAAPAQLNTYAVFQINPHFSLGLWALDPATLPDGHETFLRPATEADLQMARHVIKSVSE